MFHMAKKKTVVIGLLGTNLDQDNGAKRWEKWRPTISLFQSEDLIIDRFELIYDTKFKTLADMVTKDIQQVSPETEVVLNKLTWRDPWDFEESYAVIKSRKREPKTNTKNIIYQETYEKYFSI